MGHRGNHISYLGHEHLPQWIRLTRHRWSRPGWSRSYPWDIMAPSVSLPSLPIYQRFNSSWGPAGVIIWTPDPPNSRSPLAGSAWPGQCVPSHFRRQWQIAQTSWVRVLTPYHTCFSRLLSAGGGGCSPSPSIRHPFLHLTSYIALILFPKLSTTEVATAAILFCVIKPLPVMLFTWVPII